MGWLDGKAIMVAGGAGNIGRDIVRHLLSAGATVVVPSRNRPRIDQLVAYLTNFEGEPTRTTLDERLRTIQADIGRPDGAEQLRQEVDETIGALDGVVAAVGGWQQGAPLWEVALDDFQAVLSNNLVAHWVIARTFVPVLAKQPASTYTLIGGDADEDPVPGAGPVCMAGAAQLMMMRTLVAELRERTIPVRVNQLILGPVMTAARTSGRPEWITSGEVGEVVSWLASDNARMVSGTTIHLLQRPATS